ncbi:MAG: STAS domain-containing protein [Pseudomonadota bacterium]
MSMDPQPSHAGGAEYRVAAPSPRLNLENAEDFKNDVRSRMGSQCRKLTIDLAQTEFIDSSGIGALVGLRKAVGPDGTVVLLNPADFVQRVLKLTRMESVFQISPPLN